MGQLRGVDSESLTLIEQLSGAFLAGALASAVTNPLDVVKTNMQVYSVSEGGQATIMATIRHIMKTEGASAFMKGMNARILWIAPGTAITMAACTKTENLFAVGFPPLRLFLSFHSSCMWLMVIDTFSCFR
jgi:hypothetical protein